MDGHFYELCFVILAFDLVAFGRRKYGQIGIDRCCGIGCGIVVMENDF
jgi:hypothetical protein